MKKKKTQSQTNGRDNLLEDFNAVKNMTLDTLRMFGKGAVKRYPDVLNEMGVFQDDLFVSFCLCFYDCLRNIGLETAEDYPRVEEDALVLHPEAFNVLVGTAAVYSMTGRPIREEEVMKLKEDLNNPVIGTFLYTLADTVLTLERAKQICATRTKGEP